MREIARFYITGDTHGPISINKLSYKKNPRLQNLTTEDYLFIAGDFGLVFDPVESNEEKWWLDWLNKKPWTTIVVGGNHENYDRIEADYPISEWRGAKVRFIRPKVIWVERGEILNIEGTTFFCFSGGVSQDKWDRKPHYTWWEQEEATKEEMQYAVDILERYNNKVDYCITHEPDFTTIDYLFYYDRNPMNAFFDLLDKVVDCKQWYHGHMHTEYTYRNHTVLYHTIKEVGEIVSN